MEYRISNKLAALKPSAIREIFKSLADPSIIAFAAGNPAAESFPVEALAEITADIFANEPVKALQYGQTEGYPPLREAVNKRLSEKFSIGCSVEKGDKYNDTTLIVSGGNQGIEHRQMVPHVVAMHSGRFLERAQHLDFFLCAAQMQL